jgi:uncharacterized membrane protein
MGASPSEYTTQESASAPFSAARRSIVVNAPVERTYAQWARIEDLPKFVTLLRNVQRMDDTQFSYTWGPNGEEHQGVLHLVLQIPCRRIAWRIMSNPLMSGVVSFDRRSKQETEVTLKIHSVCDPLNLSLRVEEYLGNFKRLVEREDTAQ